MFLWADACSRLGLADRAGDLYELLEPFPGQFAYIAAGVFGSIDWALGVLATTMGRHERAESHFAAAEEIDARLGAPLFVARTHTGWARTLITQNRPEDIDRAKHMLEQADEVARRLGAGLITREVAECRSALSVQRGA